VTDLGRRHLAHRHRRTQSQHPGHCRRAHGAADGAREGELVIVDGVHGVLIVAPDELVLEEYKLRRHQLELGRQKLKGIRATPAATKDGTPWTCTPISNCRRTSSRCANRRHRRGPVPQ